MILVLVLPACHRPKQRYKPAILVTRGDVAAYVRDALEHEDADIRRSAIEHLSRTRHGDLPGVVDAYALAARMDGSDSVRRAAIRALGQAGGRKALETSLVLLDPATEEPAVPPADDKLRFDAIKVLHGLAESGSWDEDLHRLIRDTAMELLASDPARDVRLCAARLLGGYPTIESARALVAAMGQSDFGIVYASQSSLQRLTGQRHELDAAQWRQWLESTDDPFAARGVRNHPDDAGRKRWWWPRGRS